MDAVNNDYILSLIKSLSICFSSNLLYVRLSNLSSASHKLKDCINVIMMTICFYVVNMIVKIELLNTLLILIIISFTVAKKNKHRFDDTFIYMLIAFSISFILYIVCAFLSIIITILILRMEAFSFIQAIVADLLLIFITAKISKRLYMPTPHENQNCIMNIFLSGIIYIFHSIGAYEMLISDSAAVILVIGECLCLLILLFGLRSSRAASFNTEVYKSSLVNKNKEYEELQISHDDLAKKVHRDNKFLLSLYSAVEMLAKESNDIKTKEEAIQLLSELDDIRGDKSYGSIYDDDIPMTDIIVINALLRFMVFIAKRNSIEIKITTDNIIKGILDYISVGQLETLIADLIENAIKAVMASDNKKKIISILFGYVDGCYIFSIMDNGVPFADSILEVLGKEKKTTYIGGSGIGYMTIFKILQDTNASLIIDQRYYQEKAIVVRFDGKNEFIVY